MPRIPHSILLKAYNKSPLLPLVLQGTRTLPSAINELRWLKEHVATPLGKQSSRCSSEQREKLLQLCRRRSRGEPLQYILGSQPFGELDIECRRGVLIPRPETEAYTTYLAHLITSSPLHAALNDNSLPETQLLRSSQNKTSSGPLKILDLCTGSGCISLLLNSLVSKTHKAVQIYGWDISPSAITLATQNLKRNVELGHLSRSAPTSVLFDVADIFDRTSKLKVLLSKRTRLKHLKPTVDIIISNPPYISATAFRKETTRSVRNWEPKLALVPGKILQKECPKDVNRADLFYHRLLTLHSLTFESRVLVMEVGDEAQALRVAKIASDMCGMLNQIEIWRDSPEVDNVEQREVYDFEVTMRGAGQIRAVTLFRNCN